MWRVARRPPATRREAFSRDAVEKLGSAPEFSKNAHFAAVDVASDRTPESA
jgi:hypothetical protein